LNASKQNEKATFGSLFSFPRHAFNIYTMLTDSSLINGFSAGVL